MKTFKASNTTMSALCLVVIATLSSATLLRAEPQENQKDVKQTVKETITFQSSNEQTHLIELYTSQGCSSCPPADDWLSSLKSHTELWQTFVPIAFHVDYWDWIGWKDPFAKKQHSKRQKDYKKSGDLKSVYTPGLVLNGFEWRVREGLGEKNQNSGILRGTVFDEKRLLDIQYDSSNFSGKKLVAHVALLGFDIEVNVPRGENSGRKLKHDFVVLDHQHHALSHEKTNNNVITKHTSSGPISKGTTQFELPNLEDHNTHAKRFGIAVWVSEANSLTPLQASGTWL